MRCMFSGWADIGGFFRTAGVIIVFSLVILILALILTYLHLWLAEMKIKGKISRRMKDPGRVKKIFDIIEKRNKKFEERKKQEKEIFLEKLRAANPEISVCDEKDVPISENCDEDLSR